MNNACILWQGASLLDGSPIVVILTGLLKNSNNSKTGRMIQSWIIRQDIAPTTAANTGADYAICGNCPLKKTNTGACYVNLIGVNNVYRKYKASGYKPITQQDYELIKLYKIPLRIGSYGDPGATPIDVWRPLLASTSYTGYTHQYHLCDQEWRNYLMASVESVELARQAQNMGWRTFRVAPHGEAPQYNEIVCTSHTHKHIQCESCLLCSGSGFKPNIVDYVHGLQWKISNFQKYSDALATQSMPHHHGTCNHNHE